MANFNLLAEQLSAPEFDPEAPEDLSTPFWEEEDDDDVAIATTATEIIAYAGDLETKKPAEITKSYDRTMSEAIAAQNQSKLIRSDIFEKFPEELKDMIFAETASTSHQPQLILQSDQKGNRYISFATKYVCPAILHISHDARRVGLTSYVHACNQFYYEAQPEVDQRAHQNSRRHSSRHLLRRLESRKIIGTRPCYVDFTKDIIYITPHAGTNTKWLDSVFRKRYKLTQHLAFDFVRPVHEDWLQLATFEQEAKRFMPVYARELLGKYWHYIMNEGVLKTMIIVQEELGNYSKSGEMKLLRRVPADGSEYEYTNGQMYLMERLLEKEFRKLEDRGKGIMPKVEFRSKYWTC